MLSILVCHSYFLRFDSKQVERGKPYPPLATLQCAALLRRAGHRVSLFDAMLSDDLREYERRLQTLQPHVVLLYEDNFNFLSKMCLAKMRRAACQMIAAAQRNGARVIAAGSDVSDAAEPYIHAGADIALKGAGRRRTARDPAPSRSLATSGERRAGGRGGGNSHTPRRAGDGHQRRAAST
jgi:anaerobic magnesium-protoporphyrin IX monomethyl ester cyclase